MHSVFAGGKAPAGAWEIPEGLTIMRIRLVTSVLLGFVVLSLSATSSHAGDKDTPITWKKTVIEGKFRSEGVAVADVNKDGKLDVLIGDSWYEAPSWTKHDIRKPGDYGDGLQELQPSA